MQVIFEGIIGSRLYGTCTENSDWDYMEVVIPSSQEILLGADMKSSHNIKGDTDTVTVPFQALLNGLLKGSPNYWEFMFAHYDMMYRVLELHTLACKFKSLLSEALPLSYIGMARSRLNAGEYYHCVRAIDSIRELCETKTLTFPYKNAKLLMQYKNGYASVMTPNKLDSEIKEASILIRDTFGKSTEAEKDIRQSLVNDLIYIAHYNVIRDTHFDDEV